MPPSLLDAIVVLNRFAVPVFRTITPNVEPSEIVELRAVSVAAGWTTTWKPLLPTSAELSTSKLPRSSIAEVTPPPPSVIRRAFNVTEEPSPTSNRCEGNTFCPAPEIVAPGGVAGPSTVCAPLLFVNLSGFSGTYVPDATTIVFASRLALAFSTASSSCRVVLTLNVAAPAPPASNKSNAPIMTSAAAHARGRATIPSLIVSSSFSERLSSPVCFRSKIRRGGLAGMPYTAADCREPHFYQGGEARGKAFTASSRPFTASSRPLER